MNMLLQSMMLLQVNAVGSFVHAVQQVVELGCVRCEGSHNTDTCPQNTETVTYLKIDLYLNTYNAGWKDHPNFSWGGQEQDTLKVVG